MGVSVIIPVFNGESFVADAIRSALNQTIPPSEILVIDDCSTDQTTDVVRAIIATGANVRLLGTSRNLGPSAARNIGIAASTGDWLALLDADDRFAPNRIERLASLAAATSSDIVSDNVVVCKGREAQPMYVGDELPQSPFPLTLGDFLIGCLGDRHEARKSFGFMQPMFAKAFLERHAIRFDERNRFGEDFLFSLECLEADARWAVTPEALYLYTLRTGSLTERQSAADLLRIRDAIDGLIARLALRREPALSRIALRYRAKLSHGYYYRAFTDAVKSGHPRAALRILFSSPTSLGHVIGASVEQAPVIARKALRGGYGAKSPSSGEEGFVTTIE